MTTVDEKTETFDDANVEAWAKTEKAKKIAAECAKLAEILQRKNAAYGDTAGRTPYLVPDVDRDVALFVRMSDKIARIRSLLSGAEPNDESLQDTIRDLAGYCVLFLVSKT